MKSKLTKAQKELVEKAGVVHQRSGLSPAAARIFSLLMIVDEAELGFDDIREMLNLSKSAVSTALNSLMMLGRIEYYTKPGDRKRYFFVNPVKHENDNTLILKKLAENIALHEEILAQRSASNPKYNTDLKRMITFTRFMHDELAEAFKKWNKTK